MTTEENATPKSKHGMTVYRILTTCTGRDLADGSSEKSHQFVTKMFKFVLLKPTNNSLCLKEPRPGLSILKGLG